MLWLKKLLRIPLRQMWLIPKAIWLLCWYRWRVEHRPFAELSPHIGKLGLETPIKRRPAEAWDVKEIMDLLQRRLPWKFKCLPRALAAKKLLNGLGCPCTLYCGVALDEDGKMGAHAWLRCGNLYVTGGELAGRYTVTAMYGDE